MSRNADMERASTVKQLTSFFMHKHYCENDVEAIISYFSDDLAWIGAAEHEYAVGGEVITQIFRQFTGKLPPLHRLWGKVRRRTAFPGYFSVYGNAVHCHGSGVRYLPARSPTNHDHLPLGIRFAEVLPHPYLEPLFGNGGQRRGLS